MIFTFCRSDQTPIKRPTRTRMAPLCTFLSHKLEGLNIYSRLLLELGRSPGLLVVSSPHYLIPCRPTTRRLTRCVTETFLVIPVPLFLNMASRATTRPLTDVSSVSLAGVRTPSCASVLTTRTTIRRPSASSNGRNGTRILPQAPRTAQQAPLFTPPSRSEAPLQRSRQTTTRNVRSKGFRISAQDITNRAIQPVNSFR